MFNYIYKSPHRNLLEEKLKVLTSQLKGKILDAGSKNRPYDYLFEGEIIAIDLKPLNKSVQKGDITDLKFNDGSFDGILSTEVFEYIKEPKKAIFEIHRVLKKDGIALVSVPFMYKAHQDAVRYTREYLAELFLKWLRFLRLEIFIQYFLTFYETKLSTLNCLF
jgi:SAM-dependent methyltransferase